MLQRRSLYYAVGVLLALVLSFLAGRYSKPEKKIEMVDRKEEKKEAVKEVEHKNVASDTVTTKTTVTRKAPPRPPIVVGNITCPSCPEVNETIVTETKEEKKLDTSVIDKAVEIATKTEEKKLSLEINSKPRFSVSLLAGWDKVYPQPTLYQAQAGVRIFGTVWADIALQLDSGLKHPAFLAGVRVEF